ncbi:Major facilitator superfamily transporter [Apiospora aurea]|uniref:Major facilitator superfamily transporter n=1 Tax=Apiospora aurea TaxID=335848 RepID=A0ABR1QHF3_9PEZI
MASETKRRWNDFSWYAPEDTKEERRFIRKLDLLIVPYAFVSGRILRGSWYRGDEIGRRGGIFYVGLSLGTLTAGLIQAGASARLDGVSGLAGWRWMYIICALITIPIGMLGYFVIPGTPDQPNRLVLTEDDVVIGEKRLKRAGHQSHGKLRLRNLKSAPSRPQFWAISQSTTAWTPLLVFRTVEAPRFPKGYAFCLACAVVLIVLVHVLNTYLKRKEAKSNQIDAIENPEAASLDARTVDNKR